MGKVSSREDAILEVLKENQKLSLAEIVSRFGISDSTARRLCVSLERKGKVIRGFGSIYSISATSMLEREYKYEILETENVKEKRDIGAYASGLVESGDIIFISGGTTVAQFSKFLAERIKQEGLGNVLITTTSVINAEILAPVTRLVLIGGEYRPHRRDVAGFLSEKMIANMHFNKCFLGIDAIDVDAGLMAFDVETGNLDELVSAHSDVQYLLADSQKFKRKSFISYSNVTTSHVIITDSRIDSSVVNGWTGKGIKIVVV